MMDLVLVRQRMFVDGIECLITEMLPEYPPLTKYHGPFARIIALPGSDKKTGEAATKAIAGKTSPTQPGAVDGAGRGSRRR